MYIVDGEIENCLVSGTDSVPAERKREKDRKRERVRER